ncbi:hypothetical protein FACS189479_05480 [Spirochaetia bacterium]|nr:hypothetical protein FACS189479_05480 [Spirochaetia bacterium]
MSETRNQTAIRLIAQMLETVDFNTPELCRIHSELIVLIDILSRGTHINVIGIDTTHNED